MMSFAPLVASALAPLVASAFVPLVASALAPLVASASFFTTHKSTKGSVFVK